MAEQDIQTRVRSVMEDPSAQAIARVYANSLLDAAAAQSLSAADVLEELGSFLDDVLAPHPEFEQILLSAIVNREEKIGAINRVVAPNASELLTNFLRVLARHERLDVLPVILGEALQLHDTREGRKRVQVVSAKQLSDPQLEKIRASLAAAFPFEPVLEPHEDASLLGGLTIQIDNTVYDSSLRTRLKQLRSRLRERSLHEIQSGRDRFSHPEGD